MTDHNPSKTAYLHKHPDRKSHSASAVSAIILLAFAMLMSYFLAGCGSIGLQHLRKGYEDTVPTLPDMLENTTVEIDNSEGNTVLPEEWKSGWIRYEGDIYKYKEDILTFLVMGIDKWGKVTKGKNGIDGGQADALFLLIMDPELNKMRVLAINRNTMADVDIYDEAGNYLGVGTAQICLQHGYGDGLQQSCERQVRAVRKLLYNLPIHGYIAINKDVTGLLANAVDGVTVPRMTHGEDGEIIYGDDQTLYGKDAIYYVSKRGEEYEAARFRLQKEKVFFKALFGKIRTRLKENPTVVVNLYNSIAPYILQRSMASMIWMSRYMNWKGLLFPNRMQRQHTKSLFMMKISSIS